MDSLAGWTPFGIPDLRSPPLWFQGYSTKPSSSISICNQTTRDQSPAYVGIWKVITPTLLSGTQSMRFYYKGTGRNTIELKLFYDPDGKDEASAMYDVNLTAKTIG